MTKKNHDIIDVVVLKRHETESAILVIPFLDFDRKEPKKVWLPKSQVEINSVDEEGFANISLPEWLAEEKGLI